MYTEEGFVPAWTQCINWPPTVSSVYYLPSPRPLASLLPFLAALQAEDGVRPELNLLTFWNTLNNVCYLCRITLASRPMTSCIYL